MNREKLDFSGLEDKKKDLDEPKVKRVIKKIDK